MRTKKAWVSVIGALLLIVTVFLARSDARVDVSIGINIPAYTFAAPPPLVVYPGTYAYYVPDIDIDVLFYHGYWYRPYEGRWFRARYYNGPWVYIVPARVPRILFDLPPDFRSAYPYERAIPYGEFNRNWRRWERNRYWDRDDRWREGRHGEGRWEREERRERHRER